MQSGSTDEISREKYSDFIVFIEPPWNLLLPISMPSPHPPMSRFFAMEKGKAPRRASLCLSSITCSREGLQALL